MKEVEIKGSFHLAVVLSPKQPFIDWVNNLNENRNFTFGDLETSVFMFPDYKEITQVEDELPLVFDKLFLTELMAWTDNELLFPKSRTYEMFNEWFHAEVILNVFNVVENGQPFSHNELTEDQKKYWPAHAFHEQNLKYLEEYKDFLLHEKSDGSLASHGDIVHQFINFLFSNVVTGFEEITVAMVRSKFYAEFKRYNEEKISKEELQKIVRGFFEFLEKKKGVRNERVMKGLS